MSKRIASKKTASTKQRTLAQMRSDILQTALRYGATNIRVFGSFARGEQHKKSDIDLLITLPKHASLLVLVGIKMDLEELLHRKVDVVADDSIKPLLRERILADACPL